MLFNIGQVGIPPALLQKVHAGSALSTAESDIIGRVPQIGHDLLARIPRLQRVARIVLYQRKGLDGSGPPYDGTPGREIPIESRILRVLIELAAAQASGVAVHRAMARMAASHGEYDLEVVAAAQRCLGLEPKDHHAQTPRAFRLSELRSGDVLASDVRTIHGLTILNQNTRIIPIHLERLQAFAELNGIEEPVFIRASSSGKDNSMTEPAVPELRAMGSSHDIGQLVGDC